MKYRHYMEKSVTPNLKCYSQRSEGTSSIWNDKSNTHEGERLMKET